MSFVVVRAFPKQNAFQVVQVYKSASGAAARIKKDPRLSIRRK